MLGNTHVVMGFRAYGVNCCSSVRTSDVSCPKLVPKSRRAISNGFACEAKTSTCGWFMYFFSGYPRLEIYYFTPPQCRNDFWVKKLERA